MDYAPIAIRFGGLDMQVCVPADYTDQMVLEFAERQNPCGTQNGWVIRSQGADRLDGQPERCPCAVRKGFVHIMLDA